MRLPAPLRRLLGRRGKPRGEALPLQTGALPHRMDADGRLRILLVTSRGSGRWIVPKGWPMEEMSLAEAAALEAYEEAGVVGNVGQDELGRFEHEKSHRLEPLLCEIALFALAVEQELDDWPERAERRRQWFTLEEAVEAVDTDGLKKLLTLFAARPGSAG